MIGNFVSAPQVFTLIIIENFANSHRVFIKIKFLFLSSLLIYYQVMNLSLGF